MKFQIYENEFNLYMLEHNMDNKKTRGNYRSWLRYLERNNYDIFNLTEPQIENIINRLFLTAEERENYRNNRDISNFRSALRKFKEYLQSENSFSSHEEDIITQSEQKIYSRRGQGLFKKQVMEKFDQKCIITGCKHPNLIIASHIKPWKISSGKERIDPNNGFPFIPNYDSLFDKGFISITTDFPHKLKVSSNLDKETSEIFGLNLLKLLEIELNDQQKEYLRYHIENIFIE